MMEPVDPKMIQNPSGLESVFNPQGIQATMARGSNVYMGGLPNAPGAGRPVGSFQLPPGQREGAQQPQGNPIMMALQRRMQEYGRNNPKQQGTAPAGAGRSEPNFAWQPGQPIANG